MQKILYTLLLVYALPLIFIFYAVFATNYFSVRSDTVVVADAISGTFFNLFRDTFGSVIVPLVTAYSIPLRTADAPVPKPTINVFFTLVALFVATVILYALITYNHAALAKYDELSAEGKVVKDYVTIFTGTISSYGKELLAYIALLLGLSLKKL